MAAVRERAEEGASSGKAGGAERDGDRGGPAPAVEVGQHHVGKRQGHQPRRHPSPAPRLAPAARPDAKEAARVAADCSWPLPGPLALAYPHVGDASDASNLDVCAP